MAAKYERIANELREKIRSRELGPGDQLPGEQQLVADYRVSLPVVRQALDVLESEGLVDRIHGRGTYVRAPRQRVRRTPERYQWEKDRVLLSEAQRGRTGATEKDTGLTMSDLEFSARYDTVHADEDLAATFKLPVGAKLLRRRYSTKSRQERAPISAIVSYLPYDQAAENPALLEESNEPWPGGTQHQLYTIGIELECIIDHITTRPPGPEEVEELDLRPGVSVFCLRKVSVSTTGAIVEVSDVVLPGDRTEFVYTTTLAPWKKEGQR
ncbi:transcriptional regulator, GntR family [Micromonospora echinaurantiaca]|uniref:Transcriptional regulator, GntR family n=1 Tax=Micromonospora echinaurantiaca TaxID=47857 RepID=A0A1C5JZJ7_9ACTN|nr:GntR family transcriptional regulator [Micromonospora echinaurantiaca]SCG75975.1 transcriptional regulator, GntR family [Micromonospora echinaurantiaca]